MPQTVVVETGVLGSSYRKGCGSKIVEARTNMRWSRDPILVGYHLLECRVG